MKYTMHKAEKNEKKPEKPAVQTAVKTDVQEALEILLTDNRAAGTKGKKKMSLPDRARVFREKIDALEEMEVSHE